ncbi:protease HtpX [Gynuella sunshinyii]|uniref:Protease HtpX n=1 Tax=Gynuella sunshinyii YC6258 TaxID=1445510 RepID=A0A0C5W2J2_9GAMM|nr:protease HtpX [Gynuella sunshinyii]AJQ96894.1 Zn-dependent protease with chaperone function [Gynuella sunshinyii YC6258]
MMRSVLFLATNLAVVLTFGVFLNIILPALGIQTGNMMGLLIFCMLFGVGGSFISLMLSKKMALMSVGGKVIDTPQNSEERWLVNTVARLAKQAGLPMPEVALYQSPDINAFATGSGKDKSLVAVSTGLLHSMNQDEREAVLAHELSHIANGDMVTMALIQGVLNTFVMFFARIVAEIISNAVRSNNQSGEGLGFLARMGIIFVMEMVFGLIASVIAMWFSRQREYRADAGAGCLVGKEKMIAALQRLKQSQPSHLEGQLTAFGIIGRPRDLLSSHPSLDDRIRALQSAS